MPSLKNKQKNKLKVLITAGPTRAYLDPIRYLTNYCTGALGFLLAQKLIQRGAEVVLIAGPCSQPFEELKLKKLIWVETADEMLKETLKSCKALKPNFAVFSAAVLDFRPEQCQIQKVRSQSEWKITLIPNPKIIDEVGRLFPQINRIGFKLETQKPEARKILQTARSLIDEKKIQGVCINFLQDIGSKRHCAWFVTGKKSKRLLTKSQIAHAIARFIFERNKIF